MKFTTSTALAALIGAAAAAKDSRTFAVLRFTSTGIMQGMVDPLVAPGKTASHAHNIMGGSAFGVSVTGEELLNNSTCSNAMVKGDYSNYWFPIVYFHDPITGQLEEVEVFYVNAYYFFEATADDIKPFPVGLGMLVGDPDVRTPPASGPGENTVLPEAIQPVQFTCPRDNYTDPPNYPAGSNGLMAGIGDPNNLAAGVGFPRVECDALGAPLRADIHFPSCYNPNITLTDYKNNMVWPTAGPNGQQNCPPGHIHTPHLFLEVYWNTPAFVDRWTPGGETQPFVVSTGDCTGYSWHADFISGWDQDLLQHIIDTCNAGDAGMDQCPGLFYGLNSGPCSIEDPIGIKVNGTLDKLGGNNPLTGWGCSSNNNGTSGTSPSSTAGSGSTKTSAAGQSSTGAPAGSSSGLPVTTPAAGMPAAPSGSSSGLPTVSVPAKPSPTNVAGAQDDDVANPSAPGSTLPTGSSPSQCSASIHTVYETVTVTAGSPAATATAPSTAPSSPASGTVAGWQLAGCYLDNMNRVLSGDVLPNLGPMTNEKCVERCQSDGFSLAGTEYGGQCYCGNELDGSSKLADSNCNVPCEGDASEICGGGWALSVYSKDGQATIKNAAKVRRAPGGHHYHRR